MEVERSSESSGESAGAVRPDPEVVPKATRRRFSAKYKLKVLREADELMAAGQGIGALLRREGLYSSHLSDWRKARERGLLEAMAPKKRGRKPDLDVELKKEVVRLRRENEHLRKGLDQAELIIDVQKKLSRLLGLGEKS